MPPAVFPPILGLLGLGLGWRAAGDGVGPVSGFGEMLLGAGTLLFLVALLAWLTKPLQRPGVVLDEISVLPGRVGLAAMTLSGMALAAALAPYAPGLALTVSLVALAAHAGLAALVIRLILSGPGEARVLTPVWHLLFVGFILAPLSWTQLGYETASRLVLYVTLPIALGIWVVSLVQLSTKRPPAPLRPLLVIHMTPASLLSVVAAQLGMVDLAVLMLGLAGILAVSLLGVARWLTESGFSPLWGAFTFPTTTLGGALLALTELGAPLRFAAAVVLTAATVGIPIILWRILKSWIRGELGPRTNAARP
ncbi:MAG: SLAC1 family transporter [Alkalilacustris sp.]